MAIFIEGKSICAICGRPIFRGEAHRGFPAFVLSQKDKLAIFNDTNVHVSCLDSDDRKDDLLCALNKLKAMSASKTCLVCGKALISYDDSIRIALLTSDNSSPLFKFNFIQFHRDHFLEWNELSDLMDALHFACVSGQEILGLCRVFENLDLLRSQNSKKD